MRLCAPRGDAVCSVSLPLVCYAKKVVLRVTFAHDMSGSTGLSPAPVACTLAVTEGSVNVGQLMAAVASVPAGPCHAHRQLSSLRTALWA